MESPAISLQHVTIGYPGLSVLEDVTLDLFPGDSYALLGPNGSGKTALLKTIAGIIPPLDGTLVRQSSEKTNGLQVGYVPQRAALNGLLPLTAGEVVQMGVYGNLHPWQRLGAEEREQISWAKEKVEIEALEKKRYSELSGGQQQRVLIARALASTPAVLVLDEPLASLDKKTVQAMLALLTKLKVDTGMTLLWADHFIPEMLQVVQNVLEIDNPIVERKSVKEYLRLVAELQGKD